MSHLALALLGPFQLSLDRQPVTAITSPQIQALLAYLAVEGDRPHPRADLAHFLWPDRPSKTARQNLRQALSRLQRAIPHAPDPQTPDAPPFLWVQRQQVQFNLRSDHSLDLSAFLQALERCRQHRHARAESCRRCARHLETAVNLVRGDFLQGLNLDSLPFQEWALLKREWLHQELLQALSALTRHCLERGDLLAALPFAQRQIRLDPLREEAYAQAMRALAGSQRRDDALALYARLAHTLEKELDLSPSAPLQALAQAIRQGKEPPALPRSDRRDAPGPLRSRGRPQPAPDPPLKLPPQFTPFVGRAQELSDLAERLDQPDCRLLTLVGPGGVGKTRLAIQAGRERRGLYRDGIVFVPLAPLESPSQLLPALAQGLGLRFPPSVQAEEARRRQLLAFLREREILVILDNFEHLLPVPGLLLEILHAGPGIQLLVTSREPLHLRAEWLLDVPGMALEAVRADPWAVPDREPLADALALFQQTAQRVQPGFALTPENSALVQSICALVAGAPLAIELASATVRTRSLERILQALVAGLDSLATTMRDVPPRHRSIRASFDYSWRLLDEAEQTFLAQLAVFQDGFAPSTVAEVTETGAEAGPILEALAHKSLLQKQAAQVGADPRYTIHPLLAQFVGEKLAARGDLQRQARERHGLFFAAFLAQREPELSGPRQQAVLAEMRQEFGNVVRGWEWAVAQGQLQAIQQGVTGLHQLYVDQGRSEEGEEVLGRAATLLESWPEGQDAPLDLAERRLLLGRIWARQGACCEFLSEDDRGRRLLRASLDLFRQEPADPRARGEMPFALRALAVLERKSGAFAQARAHLEESLAIATALGDAHQQAVSLDELAFLCYLQNQIQEGLRWAWESLALHQKSDNRRGMARAFNCLGLLAGNQGRHEEATTFHRKTLAILRELEDRPGIAGCLNNLGLVAFKAGEYGEAEARFQECQAMFQEQGAPYGVALALYNRGRVAQAQGDFQGAAARHEEALAIRLEMGRPYLCGLSWLYLGQAYRFQGQLAQAEACLEEAQQAFLMGNHPGWARRALLLLAIIWVDAGRPAQALAAARRLQSHPALPPLEDFPDDMDASWVRAQAEAMLGERALGSQGGEPRAEEGRS